MTIQIALVLLVIAAAVVLFSLEQLPADVIAMGILLLLTVTGLLPPDQVFAGFGSDTVIMIFGLLILTAALVQTGVVDIAGQQLLRFAGDNPKRLLTVIMAISAALSAFISNTATTALFVPITLDLARRMKVSASKLLMPLAFASILASSVTVVSSSTNIVISGLLKLYDMPPLGMFELTAVGLPIAIVGLIYMLVIGQRMIPERGAPDELDKAFNIQPYLSEVEILPDSPLVGRTLEGANLGHDMDITVLRILRDENSYLAPQALLRLEAGDKLLVKGPRDEVLKLTLAQPAPASSEPRVGAGSVERIQTEDIQLVEVILLPRSPMIGHTLKALDFRQQYGLQVVGINRRGRSIYRKLSDIVLRTGDELLIQGSRTNIAALDKENAFRVIGAVDMQRPHRRRAPVAIAIFAGVLVLATFNLLSLPVAVWLGALLAFVTGCITPDAAYHAVEWKALIVIGCMLAIGGAMTYTGTAEYLAEQIVGLTGQVGAVWLLSAFFGLTMLLTQPMSNQAAALIVLPVALETALQLGLNPRTFAVMIAVGASCSFITPLEPACLMVYGPGRYRFLDFVKVGSPLTVLIYAVAIILVPLIWPF
jgi:di/tricarboxylate transporter